MTIGYKSRKWQAVLTVSASGPEHSPLFEEQGRFYRPRMAADLRYTTADVDFFETHFGERNVDSGQQELHLRLRNPSKDQFAHALDDIEQWLGSFRRDPDWDGGGILFCFAGHGREGDGGLVLYDGVVAPSEIIARLASLTAAVSPPGRLRISTQLDSCHSGAFNTELLDACLDRHADFMMPFHLFASCLEDEFSYEESSLGHGIFTYCFSVREAVLGSLAARAIQPDNTYGPSLAIAKGELGCALLTSGAQNPVVYWNGGRCIEVSGQRVALFQQDDEYIGLDEMRTQANRARDRVLEVIRPMRPDVIAKAIGSDAEMRATIHDTIKFLLDPTEWLHGMGTPSEDGN
jgi:hypothetical protein